MPSKSRSSTTQSAPEHCVLRRRLQARWHHGITACCCRHDERCRGPSSSLIQACICRRDWTDGGGGNLFDEAVVCGSSVGGQVFVALETQHPREQPHLDHRVLACPHPCKTFASRIVDIYLSRTDVNMFIHILKFSLSLSFPPCCDQTSLQNTLPQALSIVAIRRASASADMVMTCRKNAVHVSVLDFQDHKFQSERHIMPHNRTRWSVCL